MLLCVLLLFVLALGASSNSSAAVGVTFTVNATGDLADANAPNGPWNGVCATSTGVCTLRAAIQESNASGGSKDTIAFNIPTGPIEPASELPLITDPVVIDGTTQPGFVDKPIVELSGDALAAGSRGIRILAGDTTVRGLVVNRFSDQIVVGMEGAQQVGDGVRIVGNYLGTDLTGASAAGGNGNGIRIIGGSDHVIGGPDPADRNLISGNGFAGIGLNAGLDGPGKVTIQGNLIGTNANGDAAVTGPLPSPGISTGINSLSPGLVLIGGAAPGEGNVISGSGSAGQGIRLLGGPRHRVVGNKIGTDIDGENAVPNGNGILTSSLGAGAEIIDNVVSGNRGVGVELQGDVGSVVQGNKIGVDVDGLERLPNADGIYLTGTTGVLVGGTTPASRNIISANGRASGGFGSGIHFFNQASRNTIQGNLIGVGADGQDLGNMGTGIFCCGNITDPPGNVVGGTAEGAGNVIAFNGAKGILVLGNRLAFTGPRVSILGNSIYSNRNLGIDLSTDGPTPNDLVPGDPDDGPNDFQNFPVIGPITSGGGQTVAPTAFNSTPDTEFRLEYFRSTSCNEPPPSFSWFFGQGQTLVGTRNVMTDSAGNWSGEVTLAGETTPTEVITATATRFTEAGETLTGSTSEFSECLADLAITKTDEPDPVAAGGSLTYTIDVVNDGPAPATSVRVTDSLPPSVTVTSITPSQGSCSQSASTVTCELGSIARNGTARVTIVLNPGTAVRTITNTARVTSEPRDPDPSDNSATATTQVVTGGSLVVRKVTVPSPDASDTSFAFTAGGGLSPASFSLKNGASFTFAGVASKAGYSVAETPPAGWDLTSTCSDGSPVSNIDIGPGETVTCTFTNTKRGSVTLKKTTNGVVDPSKDILFVVTGPGLPSAGITRSTFGDQDGVLDFGSGNLIPAQSYKICETPVPAGFTSFWELDGVIVTPYNPDASKSPPEDLGTRCYEFQVMPGQARAFEVDNSRPGGDPRTIGYWKNWNRCTSGNQAATAQKNGGAAAGFFLVEDLLPQRIGDFNVTTCQQAVKLLSKQDQAGKSKSSDAAYELGAQLLAARFNLAAGAETCAAVQQAVLDGQTLLDQLNFTGSDDYLGSKSKDARRAQALSLAATLDRYNNGNLC